MNDPRQRSSRPPSLNRSGGRALAIALALGLALALAATRLPAADPQAASPKPADAKAASRPTTTHASTARAATVPATAPATRPATAPVLPAVPLAPKAVVLAFAAAVEKGDISAAKALVPDDPARLQWLQATIDLAGALRKLDAAAVARYGEAGKSVSQNQLHLNESFKSLDGAQEKIEGDAATLTVPGQAHPLQLKRVGGHWLIQIGPTPADTPAQLELYRRLAEAATRTTQEVAQGVYPTPEAAARVFAGRVLSARAQ